MTTHKTTYYPWGKVLLAAMRLAVLAGLAAKIYADIDLDQKEAQARHEMIQAILNQELAK